MGLNALIARLERFRRRHGLAAAPGRALELLIRRFRTDHHVFRWAPVARCEGPAGLGVASYVALDQLPGPFREAIREEVGDEHAAAIGLELAARATLWLGTIDGRAVAYQFSKPAALLDRWLVPLNPRDAVLFGFVTFERFRGRGIAAAMASTIAANVRQPDGDVYVDCKVWNKASIRTIGKAGFVRVATVGRLGPTRADVTGAPARAARGATP